MNADFWDTLPPRIADKIHPEPMSGCFLWGGGLCSGGYGKFKFRGKYHRAHRWMYEFVNGPIPKDESYYRTLCALHKCDNRACCNPDHLFLGTHQDNTRDKMNKGRHAWGSTLPQTKLSDLQVEELKRLSSDGVRNVTLSKMFGVSDSQVGRILTNQRSSAQR